MWRSEDDLGCQSFHSTFLVKSLLLFAIAYSRLASPGAPRNISHPPLILSYTLGLQVHYHTQLCVNSGDSNPVLMLVWQAHLPSESSPEPRINPLVFIWWWQVGEE